MFHPDTKPFFNMKVRKCVKIKCEFGIAALDGTFFECTDTDFALQGSVFAFSLLSMTFFLPV